MNKNETWISCRIVPTKADNLFISEDIFPFVEFLQKQKWISNFFFIRYVDIKPHIRLRLKVSQQNFENNVRPALYSTFGEVKFIPYKPEMRDYLNGTVMELIEEQFEASSIAIIILLQEKGDLLYSQAFTYALYLHIAMSATRAVSRKKSRALFTHIASHIYNDNPQYRKKMQIRIDEQKKTLQPYLRNIYSAIKHNDLFDSIWFQGWIDSMKIINKKLEDKNLDQLHETDSIYESFVHMTNNRLGINNDDEEFVALLLAKSLEGDDDA